MSIGKLLEALRKRHPNLQIALPVQLILCLYMTQVIKLQLALWYFYGSHKLNCAEMCSKV